MSDLNIHDLYKSVDQRKENKKRSFESVLKKIHAKIKQAAAHDHFACFYVVPEVVVGIPLYNITECIEYLVNALKNNGFIIRLMYPNTIYINWDPKEINKTSTLSLSYRNADDHQSPHRDDSSRDVDRFLLQHKSPHKNGKFSLNLDDL